MTLGLACALTDILTANVVGQTEGRVPMKAKDESGVRFWAIEYARNPSPGGTQESGLLCMPLPWEEGGTVRAAVMVYESRPLAEAGLEHYLAWTGQEDASYSLLGLWAEELAEILEESPEGFDRVAINPIVSLHFPEAEGYSAGLRTEEFVAELQLGGARHPR